MKSDEPTTKRKSGHWGLVEQWLEDHAQGSDSFVALERSIKVWEEERVDEVKSALRRRQFDLQLKTKDAKVLSSSHESVTLDDLDVGFNSGGLITAPLKAIRSEGGPVSSLGSRTTAEDQEEKHSRLSDVRRNLIRPFDTPVIARPVGARLYALVDFLFSPKTVEQTFSPLIADWRHEWCEAMKDTRLWKARWISLRYRYSCFKAMGLSKVFSLLKELRSAIR